jgi:hypothetical protein
MLPIKINMTMNEFARRFKDRITLFWESSSKDEKRSCLLMCLNMQI